MWEQLQDWFASSDLSLYADNLSNEKLIHFMTSPLGLGIFLAIIALAFYLKWKVVFVSLAGILAGVYVVRYTITDTSGPNQTIFLFIGGAVALAAFVIYFGLMGED